MKNNYAKSNALALCVAAILLSGCSLANGTATTPPVSAVNLGATVKLQFAVGTAYDATSGLTGLNTVVTFRQQNGLSAVLVSVPTITGPSGFVVPNVSSAGIDAGTDHISGSVGSVNPTQTPAPATFGTTGGAFSYGINPFNSDNSGAAYYPGTRNMYAEPFFGSSTHVYLGGPPADPFFNDGTFPAGFLGYVQGFDAFALTPVAGAYNLSVLVPLANAPSQTFVSAAALSNLTPLPALGVPTFVPDGQGGGSGAVTVPSDARIVETMVYVVNTTQALYFSIGPLRGTGTLSYTLPSTLGKCEGVGCQSTSTVHSIPNNDAYSVAAVSYDYPAFEASPPGSLTQTPVISGAGGQADISLSPIRTALYP